MRLLIRDLSGWYPMGVNPLFAKKMRGLFGKWVPIDTHYLFADQLNMFPCEESELGLRVKLECAARVEGTNTPRLVAETEQDNLAYKAWMLMWLGRMQCHSVDMHKMLVYDYVDKEGQHHSCVPLFYAMADCAPIGFMNSLR